MKLKAEHYMWASFGFITLFLILTWTDPKILHLMNEYRKALIAVTCNGSLLSWTRWGCIAMTIVCYIMYGIKEFKK